MMLQITICHQSELLKDVGDRVAPNRWGRRCHSARGKDNNWKRTLSTGNSQLHEPDHLDTEG